MNYVDRMKGLIRFVGGSKHNEIVWLGRWLSVIQIPIYHPQSALVWPPPRKVEKTAIKLETYYLYPYRTNYGTLWFQYVVSTIAPESPETYEEKFVGVDRFDVDLYRLLLAVKGKRNRYCKVCGRVSSDVCLECLPKTRS